jgi:arginyl-tRNA synthetase
MKDRIKQIIQKAALRAHALGALISSEFPEVIIEEPKLSAHGDFSTNFALVSASAQKIAPRKIAEALLKAIQDPEQILSKTEIAGPGFINFFVHPKAWYPILQRIHQQEARYGAADIGKGLRVQVEFVSSNPTGPLHVGHGRGAAVGDSVANILSYCGFDVQKEYYINDSGRQIQTLGRSVYLRLRQLSGESIDFPGECYQGEYIRELAAEIAAKRDGSVNWKDEAAATDFCARYAALKILSGMKDDLTRFGVSFDEWFSEQSLYDSGQVTAILQEYQKRGMIYEKDGALWFRTSDFGDEKDRVVVRQNGQTTYFASDIAYHEDKYRRGFERVIDVWGADHHGYIPRMTAVVEASGHQRDQFHVILVQLVNLLRGGQPVAMSTRAGEFVTLHDVIQEVGSDAARFIFLTRHHASPLEFDLELAKQKTNENPVYYVQYVHARIASIVRKAEERGLPIDGGSDLALLQLIQPEEIQLINTLGKYPQVVAGSAEFMEPHRITYYLMGLASDFHTYYNKHRVLEEDPKLAEGRLCLVTAVQKVIANGLTLLGVSAPETM